MFGEAVVWVAEPESEAALSVRLCSRLGLLSMCCLLSLSQYETALSAVGSVLCSTVCGACGLDLWSAQQGSSHGPVSVRALVLCCSF